MSQIVTPPDIVVEHTVYLLVNTPVWDVEMVVQWLKMTEKKYTMHVYLDGMEDLDWLKQASKAAQTILVTRKDTSAPSLDVLLDRVDAIKWCGEDQTYISTVDYLIKNG